MKVINRIFSREYEIVDSFEVGIVLTGPEVKSIRQNDIRLENAFAKIIDHQLFLFNAEIAIYKFARPLEYNLTRQRKLLMHRKEIEKLEIKLKTGGRLTLVPVSCYTKGRRIKLELALAKGRGEIGKKKLERKEDMKRQEKRDMKEYMKR